jgi:hypothetical protein
VTIKDATQKSESSSSVSSARQDNQLAFHVKPEPMNIVTANSFAPFDTMSVSPGYSLHSSLRRIFSPSSHLDQGQSIFDQMKSIAANSQNTAIESDLCSTNPSLLGSDNILHSELEQSPCPVRNRATVSGSSKKKSRSSRKRRANKDSEGEILRPGWIKTLGSKKNTSSASRQAKSENVLSLEHLQDIERGPNHKWTVNERIVLLTLRRWYILTEIDFENLFNSLTGLKMSYPIINIQFTHGGSSFNRVRVPFYSVAFTDPEHVYANIRGHIESRAAEIGIELRRREYTEVDKYERDGLRETGWTTCFVKTSLRGKPQLRQSPVQSSGQKRLGGYAIPDKDLENDEGFVGIEVAPTPSSSTKLRYFPKTSATMPCHLAFRCVTSSCCLHSRI